MKHWMCCCWAAGKKKVQLKALLLLSPLPFRTPPWCIERKLEEITTAGGGALFPSRQPNALEAICFFLLLLPATFFNLFFLLPVPHKHDLPPLSQFSSSPLPLPATTSKLHEKTKTPTSKISKLKLPSFPSQSRKLFSIRKKQSSADHMDDHTSQGGSENDLAQSLTDGNSPPPPIQKLHWPNRRRRGVVMVVVSKLLGFGAEFIASSSSVSSCFKSSFRGSPGISIPSSFVFCPWAKTSFQAGSCCRGFVRFQGLGKSSSHFFWIFAWKAFCGSPGVSITVVLLSFPEQKQTSGQLLVSWCRGSRGFRPGGF